MRRKNEQRIDERRRDKKKYLVVLEVIRVRSAVEQRLKKIKSIENKREESNGFHPILSFFLLFEECVLYYTLCMYCFAHSLSFSFFLICVRSLSLSFFSFALLLTLYFSPVCYDKREIILFSNVLLTTFTFVAMQLRFECLNNCLKTYVFIRFDERLLALFS